MTAVVLASPGPLFIDPNRQVVQSNSTITATGSAQFSGFGVRELVLVINLTIAPTGSSPTITFSMQEIDPGNGATTLGSSVTGATLNSATTQILTLPLTLTGAVQVTWTITGGSASFTGVYATLLSRSTTVLSALDASNNEHAVLVDSTGRTLIVGAGTAGTPTGGVISIQGVSGGFAIPISGTVTASNASIGLTGSAIPASATLIGASDGTNLIALKIKDASAPAAASDPSLVVALSPNSPVPAGSNVIGAVTQSGGPWSVSGTVTVQQSTPSNLQGEVGGLAAAGSAPVGNPVQIGGWDGTDIRTLSTDASGHAIIVGDGTAGTPAGGVVSIQGVSGGTVVPISGSVTASGTVTANQGTANTTANSWPTTITDGTHGPAAVKAASTAAAAADPSLVVAISPNSPLPAGASVIGAVTQSGTWTTTVTQATASNLLAQVGGLGAAGSALVGNPVQIGGSDGTDTRALLTDSSGRQNVVGAVASGSAVAGNPVLIGGSDGTDARTISTDASGHVIVVGDGTAGTPAGGVVSIQGVSGGTVVPISGSVTASGTVTANQGTANSLANAWPMEITDATHGPVAVKAASTAAAAADPSLVVALSPNSPLPAGAAVIGAVTQSGTWTVTATSATASNFLAEVGGLAAAGSAPVGNPIQIGGSDGTDIRTLLTDSSGRQEVVGAAASGGAVAGNPVLVGGSDGTDARTLATDVSGHAIIVGDGTAGTPAGGIVSIQGVSGGTAVPISGSVTASGTVTANQGTANTVANSWPTEITDGTHGPAAVKAASTAAAAADPSLVVALSPNSPIPSGANVIGAVTQSGTWTVTATSATASNFLAEVGGLGAAGSALVGNPVQIGGSDGTDTRTILTDASGRPSVVGAAANGSAVAGNPVLVAGSDGTDVRTIATSNTGNLITENKPATTSSITSVASSATTVSLLAVNANRLAALITNDGTGIMFVALAATASTTAYTYRVTSDSQILVDGFWTGAISAIWTSPNGSARITELTP